MRFLLKRIIYLGLLLGILVVPLVLLNSDWRQAAMRGSSDLLAKLASLPGQVFSSHTSIEEPEAATPLSPLAQQMEHLASRFHKRSGKLGNFIQWLDCGASRHDIMRRLDEFTEVRDAKGRNGVRLTLVSGDQLDDLAGSLTYWFDHRGRACRIQFDGVTGDPGRLISYVGRYQRMAARGCSVDALYVRDGRAGPRSLLHLSRPRKVNLETLYGRYRVKLELNISGMHLSKDAMGKFEAAG